MTGNNSPHPLDQALGLTAMPPPEVGQVTEIIMPEEPSDPIDDERLDADFSFARENMRRAVETGMDSVEKLAELAEQSQHPLMFSALASMMASVIGGADKIMSSHVKKQQARKAGAPVQAKQLPGESSSTTNIMFTGSTEDLLKFLKEHKED